MQDKSKPHLVGLHAFHEKIWDPEGVEEVSGALLLLPRVLLQVQKLKDVEMPGLQVDGEGPRSLSGQRRTSRSGGRPTPSPPGKASLALPLGLLIVVVNKQKKRKKNCRGFWKVGAANFLHHHKDRSPHLDRDSQPTRLSCDRDTFQIQQAGPRASTPSTGSSSQGTNGFSWGGGLHFPKAKGGPCLRPQEPCESWRDAAPPRRPPLACLI